MKFENVFIVCFLLNIWLSKLQVSKGNQEKRMNPWAAFFVVVSYSGTGFPATCVDAQWDLPSGIWMPIPSIPLSPAWLVGLLLFPASLISVLRNSFLLLQAPIQLGRR